MKKISLNGTWHLTGAGYDCEGTIPGSVYSFLLDNQLMEDPFYRQNELAAVKLLENEFTFTKSFVWEAAEDKVLLRCEGLDTLCDIYINGRHVAYTDNMHRTYEFDVTDILMDGENEIKVICHPVDAYIKEKHAEHPLIATQDALAGFGHIRKAHCMLGWDWGPRLPDAGIWRNIELLVLDSARITDFHIIQRHAEGRVYVTPYVETDLEADVTVNVTAPDGSAYMLNAGQEAEIRKPQLWWPNGLGDQPLYTFTAELIKDGQIVDCRKKRIGLRTLKLVREKDVYGESFCHEVNADAFARYVEIDSPDSDFILSDNYFDMNAGKKTVRILEGEAKTIVLRSVYDI